jgi:hypothetical protein
MTSSQIFEYEKKGFLSRYGKLKLLKAKSFLRNQNVPLMLLERS